MLTQRLGAELVVIPAAMPGYISSQERLVLDLAVLPRGPDAILILDGYNDAAFPAAFGIRPGDPYTTGFDYKTWYSRSFRFLELISRYNSLVRALLHRSMAAELSRNRDAIASDPKRRQAYAESVASVYLSNLRTIVDICRRIKIPIFAFLQPMKSLSLDDLGHPPGNPQQALELGAYREIQKKLKTEESELGVHDLTAILSDSELVETYWDDVHFGDRGHHQLAQEMNSRITDAHLGQLLPDP